MHKINRLLEIHISLFAVCKFNIPVRIFLCAIVAFTYDLSLPNLIIIFNFYIHRILLFVYHLTQSDFIKSLIYKNMRDSKNYFTLYHFTIFYLPAICKATSKACSTTSRPAPQITQKTNVIILSIFYHPFFIWWICLYISLLLIIYISQSLIKYII